MRHLESDERRDLDDRLSSPAALPASRRRFLQGGLALGAGLVVGFHWSAKPARAAAAEGMSDAGSAVAVNAFVRVAPDNRVIVLAKHLEMGQGCYTGLATLAAEELDADWSQVSVEAAPADTETYANLAFGIQGTGGSTAMANSWTQMRQAGATARAMLVAAAAKRWDVPQAEIRVEAGVVSHGDHSATFGELAEDAARQTPPDNPTLKDPADFVLIGRQDLGRVDAAEKSDGRAVFTLDVQRPGQLTALLERSPRFGGQVASFDATETRRVKGVVDVLELPGAVAVVAKSFWAAKKGRDALGVTWDDSKAETRGSDELVAEYKALLDQKGLEVRSEGDVAQAMADAERTFEADYEFPYLAHAPMEVLDCVIQHHGDSCEVWAGSQLQTVDQGAVARILGLEPTRVAVHTQLAGGSFGRRATPTGDIASEAAFLAKAFHGSTTRRNAEPTDPLRIVWTREDGIRGGKYRPIYVHRLRGGLDADGRIVAWEHRIVGQSIVSGTPFSMLVQDGVDATSVEGAKELPYAVPNLEIDLHTTEVGVPVLWWRSVGHTHNGYSTETFLDDLARAAGRDPVALRLELLGDAHPRHRGVLEAVAELSEWGSEVPEGRARGVALHKSFDSYVAQVAEISLRPNGLPKVHKVWCAVDCGVPINPDIIRAQMESGIGFGLGTALYNELNLVEGRVQESNFHDYRSLRIHEMPEVEVEIIASAEAPTGVGEPGLPPIAPAVANAYATLTGREVRQMPFRKGIRAAEQRTKRTKSDAEVSS